MLLGLKLQAMRQGEDLANIKFDDFVLAEIIKSSTNPSIYTMTSIKRMIDYQFKATKPNF